MKKFEYSLFGGVLFILLVVAIILFIKTRRSKKKVSIIADEGTDIEGEFYKATHTITDGDEHNDK